MLTIGVKFQNQRARMNARMRKALDLTSIQNRDEHNMLEATPIFHSKATRFSIESWPSPVDSLESFEFSHGSDEDDLNHLPCNEPGLYKGELLPSISPRTYTPTFGVSSMSSFFLKRKREGSPDRGPHEKRIRLSGFRPMSKGVSLLPVFKGPTFEELLLSSERRTSSLTGPHPLSPYAATPLPAYPPDGKKRRRMPLVSEHWPRKKQRVSQTAEEVLLAEDAMDLVSDSLHLLALRPKKRLSARRRSRKSSSASPEPDTGSDETSSVCSEPRRGPSVTSTPALSRSSSVSSLSELSTLGSEDFEHLRNRFVPQEDRKSISKIRHVGEPAIANDLVCLDQNPGDNSNDSVISNFGEISGMIINRLQ
jgi:hypothetical protein